MLSAHHIPTIAFPPITERDRIARKKPERERDLFLTPPPLGDVLAVAAAVLIGIAVALGLSQAAQRNQLERVEAAGPAQIAAEVPAEWAMQQAGVKYEHMFMKQR